MSEQTAAANDSAFRVPTNLQEFTALAVALLSVFVLIQIGAPIVRELDFLDQKLRDYFIGISFAAFPVIHRGCKQGLAGLQSQVPVRQDLTPWFVSGVIAAALLFAWNQFVSFLGGISTGIVLGQIQGVNFEAPETVQGVVLGNLAISLPLSAVAAVVAGVLLNRHSRSHVFGALALAAVFFLVFNLFVNWLAQPEFVAASFGEAMNGGAAGVAQFLFGIAFVGVIIFIFGVVGVLISRFYRERSIGRLMDAARRLPVGERDALTAELVQRYEASLRARMAAATAPVQMPGAAEP
ncbi:MAG: hypothetical protein K8S25_09305 [Alphaproteobacteria bacterium]|nr:hypothetical protein [Alphaproteobacteria bacterium]